MLPDGIIPLAPSGASPPPAFLVRFPEDTWTRLAAAAKSGQEVSLTMEDGMILNLPGEDPIALDTRTSVPTELFSYTRGSLDPLGLAAARLSVPVTAAANLRVAERVLQSHADPSDRERQERLSEARAKRLAVNAAKPLPAKPVSSGATSSYVQPPPAALPMARAVSGPSAFSLATTEKIPLKTLIVQLLALGPASTEEILDRTGGNPDEVMRVVKVIGQAVNGKYRLRPAQYAKIKIGQWKYTYDEKVKVIELARKALDELNLDADAEEREDLEAKAQEALEGGPGAAGSSNGSQAATPPEPLAQASPQKIERKLPPAAASSSRAPPPPRERNESPAPSAKPKAAVSSKDPLGGTRTKVGKQIAKMRESFVKRSSSLPNTKEDGRASVSPETEPEVKKEPAAKKIKAEPEPKRKIVDKAANGRKLGSVEMKKKNSRDYTSSEDSDSDDGRGRTRAKKAAATNAGTNGKAAKAAAAANGAARGRRQSPVYTSSEDEGSSKRRKVSVRDREAREKERERDREREREREREAKDREREREREAKDREREVKERERERERERDLRHREREREKELEREREREKEKERQQRDRDRDRERENERERNRPRRDSSTKEAGEIEDRPLKRKLADKPANGSSARHLRASGPLAAAPNEQALRDRWDEVHALYEALARSLASDFQNAERVREGGSPVPGSEADVACKIAQYQEYHKELEAIKAWFG